MDRNVPAGEVLELDESKLDEILQALEEIGFEPRRDDALILVASETDFDLDAFEDGKE